MISATTKIPDKSSLHRLYGEANQRMTYQSKDFLDYTIMMIICATLLFFIFGPTHFMTLMGSVICLFMVVMFPIRHGFKLAVPVIMRRPQEVIFLIVHKIQNSRWVYYFAIGVLLLENLVIYLTPDWPHKTDWMHSAALFIFMAHFVAISLFRTAIFISHWRHSEHVKAVLMESVWKAQLKRQPDIKLEIIFAYLTGILTHIVYLAPWYFIIQHFEFSLLLIPLAIIANVFAEHHFLKVVSQWFYRDHWLGHNSEWDFIYSHGTHHDAIPSGMIAVAGNGHLEGFFRGVLGLPIPFFNPLMAGIFYTLDMYVDISQHQYIPGVFPKIHKAHRLVGQHSLHHFGRLEPYGFGFKVDQEGIPLEVLKEYKILPPELRNSISIDEQLNDYQWDNPRQRWYLALIDKYQTPDEPEPIKLDADPVGATPNQ